MNRREMLTACLGALPAGYLLGADAQPAGSRQKALGIVEYCYDLRLRLDRIRALGTGLSDPIHLVDFCHQRRAAGVQLALGWRPKEWRKEYLSELRDKLETYGMYIEGIVSLPRGSHDRDRFAADVARAKAAGAKVIRTALLNGRRYETFDSPAAWRKWKERAVEMLKLAAKAVAAENMRLAVENHKDLRVDEFLAIIKSIGSPHVGICVDFGNNLALLEDALDVVTAYAPLAFSTHVKDIAVAEYEDGFLMAEVPLGQGILDLPKMFAVLRRAQPDLRFNLEMLTRDPLKIPCLTAKYWATSETLPARYLARTLATVRRHKSKRPLASISTLAQKEQLAVEEENVRASLAYAAKHLL
jgi:sugar phosphate isomerase/epimerase